MTTRISRRSLIGGITAVGAASLVGCQVDTGENTGPAAPSGTEINFPDYSTELPAEDVTFRWCDSGDLKSVYEKAVLAAFTGKHANIKTDYQGSGWDTVNQVVPLGIRNGSAPDIFAVPNNVPAATAVNEGWVQPLEQVIPDFDTWRANFGENAFVPGVHVFDDKVYSFPLSSDRRLTYMSFYDSANFAAAGFDDPVSQLKSWDDLHAALQKVVTGGKTGLMIASDQLSGIVDMLAQSAGWQTVTGMDLRTGKYRYDAPQVLQAFEFLQKLVTDKLVVPGFLSLKAANARSQMPAGKSGMIFNGPWDIPAWKRTGPDWKYVMGPVPSPDGGTDWVQPFAQNGANNPWVYAKTKYPTVAGQILNYMGTPDGQRMLVILSEGNLVSLNEQFNSDADQPGLLDANAKTASDLAAKIMKVAPQAAIRNPDVAKVTLVRKEVKPSWADLMAGIFTGELKGSVEAQFARFSAQQQESLEAAIDTARAEGATATLDDYTFPNWDPTKDYTKADYEALG
ncbi:ABC transporter substrate-binding protein [Microlunatus speluncae]|uniref:ABC transporter substrate-binding protein n=1 Tax=Microlunatus speluncae TaxID=2594267 RepID=UPI00126688C1|nr:ABC transporter substrate-binding protein [Microlunatus speluncae]